MHGTKGKERSIPLCATVSHFHIMTNANFLKHIHTFGTRRTLISQLERIYYAPVGSYEN
jgi:hypothetical protein